MLEDTIRGRQDFCIIPADREYELRIPVPGDGKGAFEDGDRCELYLHPMTRTRMKNRKEPDAAAAVSRGEIRFRSVFPEDEYSIRVRNATEGKKGEIWYSFFAIGGDLHSRIPLKGDIHLRGAKDRFAAAACRENGMDFASFAQKDPEWFRCGGLLTIRGAELRPEGAGAQLVQLGGEAPADGFCPADFTSASAAIRSAGGLAILSDAFRADRYSYNMPFADIRRLYREGTLDAVELIGNTILERDIWGSDLSVALWRDMQQTEKIFLPPLGGSGATVRETPTFGYQYTVVFAAERSETSILDAIRSGLCVAVEHVPVPEAKEDYRVYGSFRLVMLTRYLIDHYFASLRLLNASDALRLSAGDPGASYGTDARMALHRLFYGIGEEVGR